MVLEKDGTEVDEDEVLSFLNDAGEIFLLLEENQSWEKGTSSENLIKAKCIKDDAKPSTSNTEELEVEDEVADHAIQQIVNQELADMEVIFANNSSTANDEIIEQVDEEHSAFNPLPSTSVVDALWTNFQLNWKICTNSKIKNLKSGKKTHEVIKYFVHQVIDQLREIYIKEMIL